MTVIRLAAFLVTGRRKADDCSGLHASTLPLKCVYNVKMMSVAPGDLDENVGENHGVG